MQHFTDLPLPTQLLNALTQNNFITPTDIQVKTIPFALQGKDIMGSAQTGTGKTLAFLIPTITHLLANPTHKAIIIEPTRELAQQVLDVTITLCRKEIKIYSVLLIGGEPYKKQIDSLKNNQPRIIIGTPGRIIDHLEQKNLDLTECHTLILDETDKMFDMGFFIQLEKIFKYLPTERQTLMFSATFPKAVQEMAEKQLKDPEKVFVQPPQELNALPKDLIQKTKTLKEEEKYDELMKELQERRGSIIVFVNTKKGVDHLSRRLLKDKIRCCSIHGDLRQRTREKIMEKFRQKKCRILIGTDVLARGLDIQHVMHVINFDVPFEAEDYVHRVGRTARNGAEGECLTFLTPDDEKRWNAVECLFDPTKKKAFPDEKKQKFPLRRRQDFGHRKGHFDRKRTFFNKDKRKFFRREKSK